VVSLFKRGSDYLRRVSFRRGKGREACLRTKGKSPLLKQTIGISRTCESNEESLLGRESKTKRRLAHQGRGGRLHTKKGREARRRERSSMPSDAGLQREEAGPCGKGANIYFERGVGRKDRPLTPGPEKGGLQDGVQVCHHMADLSWAILKLTLRRGYQEGERDVHDCENLPFCRKGEGPLQEGDRFLFKAIRTPASPYGLQRNQGREGEEGIRNAQGRPQPLTRREIRLGEATSLDTHHLLTVGQWPQMGGKGKEAAYVELDRTVRNEGWLNYTRPLRSKYGG